MLLSRHRQRRTAADSFLGDVRVLEVADELGEYAGKLLAGLGADVVKVEPLVGEGTRGYGPFYQDVPGPDRSLYFWHYNFGKRSVTVDLDSPPGQAAFKRLAASADVIIDTRPQGYLAERSLSFDSLRAMNPALIMARISPFGDDGPWADFAASDLVHLALGGVMMVCGYDPEPDLHYELAPVAPQMWQAYHIAGEATVANILAALLHRSCSGQGQLLSTAVHQAVAQHTHEDLVHWIFNRQPLHRGTCRLATPEYRNLMISMTKDGRWLFPYRTYLRDYRAIDDFRQTVGVLAQYGLAEDLEDPRYDDPEVRADPATFQHFSDVVDRFVRRFVFEKEVWREFQEAGLTWAPERRPEENIHDEHWRSRETFLKVEHPELGRSFVEVGARWLCPDVPWRKGPRAPLVGEHNREVLHRPDGPTGWARTRPRLDPATPISGLPMNPAQALSGVRYLDLGWVIASSGAGRILSSLGAEVIKIEHKSRLDRLRFYGTAKVPAGGRIERDRATDPIQVPATRGLNRSGSFMTVNAGKRAISLNLKHPGGRELLGELIRKSECLGEGYSPGTMDRLGCGYEWMKELNPAIVYVQQSGMGQNGAYGRMRSYGPVAAGFAGTSEMSGLPEPFPPAGIGYSYLDFFGAYNMASAVLAGLYRRRATGLGCWIDSSQVESGIFLAGSAILDYSANGRRWSRYGNRSPYKPAAPHGAYPTRGEDRWIAIACFDEAQWLAAATVLGRPAWTTRTDFATLADRLACQDELDRLLAVETAGRDGVSLMYELQRAGVPAGVCQTAEDKLEDDPQLKHLDWLIELSQSEVGTWPLWENPVKFSETPPYQGGVIDRHGPNYAEDNAYVYGDLLGLTETEIRKLEGENIL